jgi:transcription elongation factor Elf1
MMNITLTSEISSPSQSQDIDANHPPVRARRRAAPRSGPIPIPFIWATDRRAKIHSLNHLLQNKIFNITGDVQCKSCRTKFQMSFDLQAKFDVISRYLVTNMNNMHDRAPENLMNPRLPKCVHCNQENSVKPIIAEKKKNINWLFLLLGQMLGCCKLEHLKYFCKYNNHHRTGAKNRVLYLTYFELRQQLDPSGPFNVR